MLIRNSSAQSVTNISSRDEWTEKGQPVQLLGKWFKWRETENLKTETNIKQVKDTLPAQLVASDLKNNNTVFCTTPSVKNKSPFIIIEKIFK